MKQNGIPEDKCFTSPFGVDTTLFKPRQELPRIPRFICTGTIGVRKGHPYLFRAFQLVKSALPDAELICVGDIKPDIARELPQWRHTFVHRENLSHEQLSHLLQTATAFVLPSLEEGFARVISEAMAAGLPIIATYESGAPTIVTHQQEGLIVPSRNIPELAQAMIRLHQDPKLNEQMGAAAARKCSQTNSWSQYGARLLNKYQETLATVR
jgi:glycosyltransferase involved in cell wall biosynthesis